MKVKAIITGATGMALLLSAYPAMFCTLHEVGLAMIHLASKGSTKRILEVKDIVEAAKS